MAGAARILTPSASYTSALPHWLETDRLPCFAMRIPAAAATSAAADEILKVPERSPPVPHVSKTSSNVRDSCTALARIVFARPTISEGRSPFIVRPTSSAATCGGVASPLMIAPIASAASSTVRFSRRISFSSNPEIFMFIHGRPEGRHYVPSAFLS